MLYDSPLAESTASQLLLLSAGSVYAIQNRFYRRLSYYYGITSHYNLLRLILTTVQRLEMLIVDLISVDDVQAVQGEPTAQRMDGIQKQRMQYVGLPEFSIQRARQLFLTTNIPLF